MPSQGGCYVKDSQMLRRIFLRTKPFIQIYAIYKEYLHIHTFLCFSILLPPFRQSPLDGLPDAFRYRYRGLPAENLFGLFSVEATASQIARPCRTGNRRLEKIRKFYSALQSGIYCFE